MPSPSVSDHFRPSDPDRGDDVDYEGGVYRVVGTDDETVTLLRVADADGRRVHAGEIVKTDPEALRGFEPAVEPTNGRSIQRAAASALETAYWSGWAFIREIAAHPLPSAVALAFVVIGFGGGTASCRSRTSYSACRSSSGASRWRTSGAAVSESGESTSIRRGRDGGTGVTSGTGGAPAGRRGGAGRAGRRPRTARKGARLPTARRTRPPRAR